MRQAERGRLAPTLAGGPAAEGPAAEGPAADGAAADGAAADDAAVIGRSRLDPEQFAVLFDRHAPRIHRYLARRVGRDIADDLTAETFLAAFGKRERYDPRYRDAAPWLYGIATNLIGAHRRDEVRQLRIRQAVVAEPDVPGHAERVAADLTARATRGLLTWALASLSVGERDVLILIAWEQLTYEETAQALDIPVGTVRSRLNRTRARLREVLAATGRSETLWEILTNE